MLACVVSRRSGVVRPQRPRLFSIQVTIGIWDGVRRGGRAGSRRRGFDRRGRDKAMGVGSGASWDKGVLLVCARCSRRGGAARTGLGVRARRQYKQSGVR